MKSTPILIVLLFVTIMVMAALGGRRSHKRKERATSNDDQIFQTAPYWAKTLNQKLNTLIAGQRRLHQHIGSEADADYERDNHLTQLVDDVVAKATAAKTVSESTNIAVREVLRLLREGQADPADTQKLTDAMAILEAMRVDDATMLTDNTPVDPSAN